MGIKLKQLDDSLAAIQGVVLFNCTATEQPFDLVYISAADTAAQADASNSSKIDVIGYILDKPTSTTCNVASVGLITSSGLTVGLKAYLSATTPGGMTQTEPTSPDAIVEIGLAKSTTSVLFSKGAVIL